MAMSIADAQASADFRVCIVKEGKTDIVIFEDCATSPRKVVFKSNDLNLTYVGDVWRSLCQKGSHVWSVEELNAAVSQHRFGTSEKYPRDVGAGVSRVITTVYDALVATFGGDKREDKARKYEWRFTREGLDYLFFGRRASPVYLYLNDHLFEAGRLQIEIDGIILAPGGGKISVKEFERRIEGAMSFRPPPTALRFPLRSAKARPFRGRKKELERLVARLSPPGERSLIRLYGPMGVGKSSLLWAVVCDNRVRERFKDRIIWADVEEAQTVDILKRTLARDAGCTGKDPVAALRAVEEPTLLVLDGLEVPLAQARSATLDVLGKLCENPNLSIAVTTRSGESIGDAYWTPVVVRCLKNGNDPGYATAHGVFAEASGREFDRLNAEEKPLLDQLIREVADGLPLVIALIGHSYRKKISLASLWEQWQQQAMRLPARTRGGSKRLHSIPFAILPSWNLLPESEQRVLRMLALLPGGCREAELAALEPGFSEEQQERLRDSGLVVQRTNEEDPTKNRLRLLNPVRQSLLQDFPAPTPAETENERSRVIRHYIDLAMAQSRLMNAESVAVLLPEMSNLESVLSMALDSPFVKEALEVFDILHNYILNLNLLSSDLLEKALQTALACHQQSHAAMIQVCQSARWRERGNMARAMEVGEEALTLARQGDRRNVIAGALKTLGDASVSQASYDQAKVYLLEAETIYQEIGSRHGVGTCKFKLGELFYYQDDFDRALPVLREAVAILEDKSNGVQDRLTSASCRRMLAEAEYLLGNPVTALRGILYANRLYKTQNSGLGMGNCLCNAGEIYLQRGRIERARSYMEKALEAYRKGGYALGCASAYMYLGVCDLRDGLIEEGAIKLTEAHDTAVRLNRPMFLAEVLYYLAEAALHDRQDAAARVHADEAMRLSREIDYPLIIHQSQVLRGIIEYRAGNPQGASTLLNEALLWFTGRNFRYDRAITHHYLSFIEPERSAYHQEQSESIWGRPLTIKTLVQLG